MARYHGVLDHWRDNAYYRAVRVGGGPALFRATQPNIDAPLTLETLTGPDTTAIASRMLCVDVDFAPFYAIARADNRLWPVVAPLYGAHHLQAETVFEALCLVIIEQQISLAAALRAQRALADWGGLSVTHNGEHYPLFPTPDQLAAADPTDLHAVLKITHRRVAVIQHVAVQVTSGALDLESLRTASDADAYAALMAIKGVGHWTAAWTLIRGLSRYRYAAHNDVALRDAVAHYFYDSEERVPAETVAETFAAYDEHAGLAAFYTLLAWAVAHY
jgi:DNA-3-methyladenine glycosylase II